MKTLKMILCLSLLLIGCAKEKSQPVMKYGNSLTELIENDTDQRTAELYQQLANKEYVSTAFSYFNSGMMNSVEFDNADKLTELFDLIESAIVDLNYYGPGRTIQELDAASSFFIISAVDAMGETSQFTLYAIVPHVLRIKDNSKDYLIDLGADFNLYSFFDFVYVDTQPKSNELMGEWIWANADTPNIYDSGKAFKIDDWQANNFYLQEKDLNYDNDLDSFDKAMNAIINLGSVPIPPEPSFELFIYIMKNYPTIHAIYPDLTVTSDEIHYLDGDEEKIIHLAEPIPANSTIMSGEQFRAAYRELFDRESSFDESTSWYYSPQWFVSGQYLKNDDLYVYYVYADGAVSNDYTGWIMKINDQQESQDIVTIKASVAYTEIKGNVQGKSDCFFYRQDYSLIDASTINLSLNKLDELLNVFKDDLLQLEIKLKAHADGTYSIVSIETLNERDVMQVIDSSKPIINVYKVSENDWTPIPQFNLSGTLAREVNEQLYYHSNYQKDKYKLKAYEDDQQAYIAEYDKTKINDEPIGVYRYDKITHELTDFNGTAITFGYLDQFGITEDYRLYHDFNIDNCRR